jgi:hypothetical protein
MKYLDMWINITFKKMKKNEKNRKKKIKIDLKRKTTCGQHCGKNDARKSKIRRFNFLLIYFYR